MEGYTIARAPCYQDTERRDPALPVQLGVDIGDVQIKTTTTKQQQQQQNKHIGDVLSQTERDAQPEHYDRWRFVLDGAYAFIIFFVARYGGGSLNVITRNKHGSWWTHDNRECWVVQFLRDSGFMHFLNEHQVRICKFRNQKGRMADELNLSHFIDNHRECLESVIKFDDPCCIEGNDGFMVHFTGSTRILVDSHSAWHDRNIKYNILYTLYNVILNII